ncbi:hypothetical protein [Luteimonas sp. A501]
MKRLLAVLLSILLPTSAAAQTPDWETDPTESRVGIHVIPNFGDDPTVYSPEITEAAIRSALKSVDWVAGFHQVVVVFAPGTSMEVGGSLDPEHGLSAMYRNRREEIVAVTREAPETVSDLEAILLAFIKPGEGWKQVQEFDFWHGGR